MRSKDDDDNGGKQGRDTAEATKLYSCLFSSKTQLNRFAGLVDDQSLLCTFY